MKVIEKLGKHFDQDGWQQVKAAPASTLAKAANTAKKAPPASALAPASRSASALVEAKNDPEYFAKWVAQLLAKMPKNSLSVKM